jgi:PAS domain S-box-containing protein
VSTFPILRHLRRREKQLRDVADSLDEGVYILDKTGAVIFMNSAAENMLGWSETELIGRDMHRMTHNQRADGSHFPTEECPVNLSLSTGQKHIVEEDVFTRKDGSTVAVRYRTTPMLEDDAVVGCVTAFRSV